ncbi:MAG TPA: LEA family epithelial adhesin, partial [Lactobacillus johnsonii]|nr:LEA family epithelial adhesin [Lactobacillus johnsonii]
MKRLEFLETKRTPRYSLRKFSVGMVSVLLGVTIFGINFTNHSVKAATESVEGSNSSANSRLQQTSAVGNTTAEQANTQKATSATEKVQQSSGSNNATANNSTEAATTSQSVPKTQGSADTDIKSSTAKSAAMNLVAIPSTDRNAAGTVAPFFYNLFSLGTGTQSAKENQDLANKTNLTSSDNYSSNIYKDKDGNYYKIVTINGHDYVYRTADIQANGTNILGTVKGTADDNKNNIHISKEDLGNGKTRWTVTFFPKMGLQNADSSTLHGLISAKFGIALTNDYQIVGNVDMKVKNKTDQTYIYYTFESGSSSAKRNTIQNPSPEVKFSFNPKTDVDKNTGLINSKTMPAYNNEYLQGPYYFTTATNAGKKNLWQTYFKYWGVESKANNNEYDGKPYVGTEHGLNFNNFKIVNENGVDGAKYGDPIIYDKLGDRLNSENGLANSESGVFSSDDFNQAMEFKSQGESTFNIFTDRSQHSSYVISFTTQHTDSDEVGLATGSKNQQFSGISANIYSDQNGYFNMYSRLYGEQRALDADGVPLKAENIIPNWDDAKAANKAIDDALVNKKGEINTATNIDQATKDNLIKEATDAAGAAKNAIGQATTVDEIKKAQDYGITNINNVKVPTSLEAAKQAATKVVEDAVDQQKALITKANNLSDKEKQALNNQVDEAAK